MVGIFRPRFAIALDVGLEHINAEVGGQVAEGPLLQCRHAVGTDGDGAQALASLEGTVAHVLQRVGQGDALQGCASAKGGTEMGYIFESLELIEALDAVVQDTVNVSKLCVFRGEEMSLPGEGAHHLVVLKRSHHKLATAGNLVAPHEIA